MVVARVVGCSGMIYPQRRWERAEATNPREIGRVVGGGIGWWWQERYLVVAGGRGGKSFGGRGGNENENEK